MHLGPALLQNTDDMMCNAPENREMRMLEKLKATSLFFLLVKIISGLSNIVAVYFAQKFRLYLYTQFLFSPS